jgi:hypothetical protein
MNNGNERAAALNGKSTNDLIKRHQNSGKLQQQNGYGASQ